MSNRGIAAFVVGTTLFALAPVFDPVLPADRPDAAAPLRLALGGSVAVGALVVLIAGDWRAWVLALASAFVAALLSLVHVAAPGPPPPSRRTSVSPTQRPTCSTSSPSPARSPRSAGWPGAAPALASSLRRR